MKRAPVIDDLVLELSRLPSVGPKSATRLAYHLLSADKQQTLDLAEALSMLAASVTACPVCFNFAQDDNLCVICSDPRREATQLCVVEAPTDIPAVEGAGFRGLFHVLGGSLDLIAGVTEDDLSFRELAQRAGDSSEITEVIIATNGNTSGDATAFAITRILAEDPQVSVTVSRLACGLPYGSDIDHADEVTMTRAFAGRVICD